MREPIYYQTRPVNLASIAADSHGPWALRILGSSREVSVVSPNCSIGTARNNTVVLSDPYVSKHHCSLVARQGAIWIQDEGSRNGTWVNNIRIDRCEIDIGVRIMLGRTALQLVGKASASQSNGIIGEHPKMQKVFSLIERLSRSQNPVLIEGETGTGKELVARALHVSSSGHSSPFEPINCGAIPRELAESELFGHVQGAFTGANRERKGAFERADGGTLFLDEIGEMPLELQPKLLRVLEEGMVRRLGDEQHRPITVRVVAATHRDLLKEAERGRFRLDLYHRLAIGVIRLPPLRERLEDIPLLIKHFLKQNGETSMMGIDESVIEFLQNQSWRGNIRELRNAIHRATIEGGPQLQIDDFHFLFDEPKPIESKCSPEGMVKYSGRTFKDIRNEIYLQVLKEHGGNRSAAAMALKIPKSTFFDQLKEIYEEQMDHAQGDVGR